MIDPGLLGRVKELLCAIPKRDATYTFRLPSALKALVENLTDDVKRDLHDTFIALMVIAVDREALSDRIKTYFE